MAKRMILMLAAVAVFIAAIGLVKYRQIQAAVEQSSSFAPPPEAVTTIVAKQERWPETLNAIGTVVAVRGVTVSADLPGIVQTIEFDSGKKVRAGDVLVRLDTRQERAQLTSAEARRDLNRLNYERMHGLQAEGIIPQADYDRSAAELKQAEAGVGEIRAMIERKTIRAPFAGILGIREINLGQYLTGGDPIVPLQSHDPIHVNFAVPQQQLGEIQGGAEVRVTVETSATADAGATPETAGKITAIDAIVDPATRNVQVQATFQNPDGKLRPGMFVEAQVVLGTGDPVVALPSTAISYAPYGDSVFIVEDVKGPKGQTYRGVRQQFVKLGPARGDQVAVLSGVKPGEEVVTSGVFKLRNGAAVEVNNEIQPSNEPAPRPEEG